MQIELTKDTSFNREPKFLPNFEEVYNSDFKISCYALNEGYLDEYNSEDSFDVELYRISISRNDDKGELVEISNWCSQLPVNTPASVTKMFLNDLLAEVQNYFSNPIKSLPQKQFLERLSWRTPKA